MKKRWVPVLSAMALVVLCGNIFAEGAKEKTVKASSVWPTKPVQIFVPAKPGGSTDIHARVFAEYLQEVTGKPFVVVNQASGGGAVAYEATRTAKPDGNTLMIMHTGIVVNTYTGVYAQPMSEFTTLAILQAMPMQVYGVSANSKWNNFKDFIEDAKANPDKYKVGVSLGAATHFIAGQIMSETGVKLKLVQAGDEVEKVAALQGGHIDIANLSASAASQYIQAGKMKVIGALDDVADPTYPEFIPIVDQGYDIAWPTVFCLFGPKDMDPALVAEINGLTKGFGDNLVVQERLKKLASHFKYRNVEETAAYMKKEDTKIGTIARDLGLSKR
jgi:tripartite-type tricarboxylate transporter receptor subunit TctC